MSRSTRHSPPSKPPTSSLTPARASSSSPPAPNSTRSCPSARTPSSKQSSSWTNPRLRMRTHGNLASNLVHSLAVFGLTGDDVAISCLPLAHITARHTDYAMFQYGVPVAYCPDINLLPQVLQEVRPTFFVGVPRLYEKVR